MRVLVVSWLPLVPADSGYKKRVTELYRQLAFFADVLVLSPGSKPEGFAWNPIGSEDALGMAPESFVDCLPKAKLLKTFTAGYYRNAVYHAKKFNPDIVVAEGLWAVKSARKAASATGSRLAVVVQNIEERSAQGVYPSPIAVLLGVYERSVYRKADLLVVLTEEECHYIGEWFPNAKPRICVVPNGSTLPSPVPPEAVDRVKSGWGIGRGERIVLFVGRLDYPPNRKALEWFSEEVSPAIRSGFSRVRWLAAGVPQPRDPLPPFEFVGYAENLGAALAAADVCIAPVRHGSGTSIKVLDYLGAGCPVVACSHAVRGLLVSDGEHLLIRDGGPDFAAGIRELLSDGDRAKRLGDRARDFVGERLAWPALARDLLKQLEECLRR
jgi:glycosyltransferase involved in cell wall biosynthesis